MKLTKNIKVRVYEVLADYKIKVKKSPFIAILKFANENGGKITSDQLYNDFLQPLSVKACENILDRLAIMGYFDYEYYDDEYYDEHYTLTNLGYEAAKQEEFYEDRNGVLKIFFAENEFIEQKVVKIEEVNRPDSFEEKDLININQTELNKLQNANKQVVLESGTFILENFQEKCRAL